MNPVTRLVAVVAGLVLLLHSTPSWGGPPNPTLSDAHRNTAGGTGALLDATTESFADDFDNTGFGYNALRYNTTGSHNTATGAFALRSNTTGDSNTATGDDALYFNTSGNSNTATGVAALQNNNTGSYNTASGDAALFFNTAGSYNTASGVNALYHSSGSYNTASGANALYSNTIGVANTASGVQALYSNEGGSYNTASGSQALYWNTSGGGLTATGANALLNNTTGNDNTASGALALFSNTTGSWNTASGVQALENAFGAKNTAVGRQALQNVTGSQNIAVGHRAGWTLVLGNNNIYLGNPGAGDESKTMRLGSTQTKTFIAGVVTAGVSGATVEIDANGQLGISPSSARYKRDIAAMGTRSEGVLQLRPVTFAYRDDVQGVMHYGLIAEEVAAVYPELVTRAATSEVQAVRYQELIPMLLNELQRQRQEFQQALQGQQHALQIQQHMLQRQHQELADLRALVGHGRGADSRRAPLSR